MCKVSENLKLCTCSARNIQKLTNYWVLQRPKKSNGTLEMIVGEAFYPTKLSEEIEQQNLKSLLCMLNSGDCFDTAFDHKDRDVLTLHFDCSCEPQMFGHYLAYSFQFSKDKWKQIEYDPFGANLYDFQQGKFESVDK